MPEGINRQPLATQLQVNRSAIEELRTDLHQFAASHDAWSEYFMKHLTFEEVLDSIHHVPSDMLSSENEQAVSTGELSIDEARSWKARLDSQSAVIIKMQSGTSWWKQQLKHTGR
jgi:hypothetical protein